MNWDCKNSKTVSCFSLWSTDFLIYQQNISIQTTCRDARFATIQKFQKTLTVIWLPPWFYFLTQLLTSPADTDSWLGMQKISSTWQWHLCYILLMEEKTIHELQPSTCQLWMRDHVLQPSALYSPLPFSHTHFNSSTGFNLG